MNLVEGRMGEGRGDEDRKREELKRGMVWRGELSPVRGRRGGKKEIKQIYQDRLEGGVVCHDVT